MTRVIGKILLLKTNIGHYVHLVQYWKYFSKIKKVCPDQNSWKLKK